MTTTACLCCETLPNADALTAGSFLTITEPNKVSHGFRFERTEPSERFPNPATFAKINTGNGTWAYLGRLDSFTGQIVPTKATTDEWKNSFAFKLLNRVLARIWAADHAAYQNHGYKAMMAPLDAAANSPHEKAKEGTANALDFLADSFVVAVGYGLKRPMIRVHFKGQRFKFYLSARGTICIKTGGLVPNVSGIGYTNDPQGDEEYMGCLVHGKFLPAKIGREVEGERYHRPLRIMSETEKEFLAKLAENPVAFLAQCSKDMCRCCYCYKALEDPRSKAVGYGETCSKRWGLAWGKDASNENVPSFAKAYNTTAHELLVAIRSNPADEAAWQVFGDWLEEKALPRPGEISPTARLPRND